MLMRATLSTPPSVPGKRPNVNYDFGNEGGWDNFMLRGGSHLIIDAVDNQNNRPRNGMEINL